MMLFQLGMMRKYKMFTSISRNVLNVDTLDINIEKLARNYPFVPTKNLSLKNCVIG